MGTQRGTDLICQGDGNAELVAGRAGAGCCSQQEPAHEQPAALDDQLPLPGWLENALESVLAPVAPPGRFEFRVGSEVASIVDGEVRSGSVDAPDVVVEGDPEGVYSMFVQRRQDLVSIGGDHALLGRLLDAAPRRAEEPVGT